MRSTSHDERACLTTASTAVAVLLADSVTVLAHVIQEEALKCVTSVELCCVTSVLTCAWHQRLWRCRLWNS
jgi:hypothetical protein